MRKETVYTAKFFSPGLIVSETWETPVESADPRTVKWPERAYAFRLYQREDLVDDNDGQRFRGDQTPLGPLYYHPDSRVETLEEVKRSRPNEIILISNMECNRWDAVVWSRWGNWPQPFDSKDCEVLT